MDDEKLEFDWYVRENDKWEKLSKEVNTSCDAWDEICKIPVKYSFAKKFMIGLICLPDDNSQQAFGSIKSSIESETKELADHYDMNFVVKFNRQNRTGELKLQGYYLIFNCNSKNNDELYRKILNVLQISFDNKEYSADTALLRLISRIPNSFENADIEVLEKEIDRLENQIRTMIDDSENAPNLRIHCWIAVFNNEAFAESIMNGEFLLPNQVNIIGIPRNIPGYSILHSSNIEKLVENLSKNKADKNSIAKENEDSQNKEPTHSIQERYQEQYNEKALKDMNKGDR